MYAIENVWTKSFEIYIILPYLETIFKMKSIQGVKITEIFSTYYLLLIPLWNMRIKLFMLLCKCEIKILKHLSNEPKLLKYFNYFMTFIFILNNLKTQNWS